MPWLRDLRSGLKLALALCPPERFAAEDRLVDNNGLCFFCDRRSYVEWNLYHFRGYERPEIRAFNALARQHNRLGLLLDIGANVGSHALAFARAFEAVHAFEPNPEIFARLSRNVAANAADNLVINKMALGAAPARLPFFAPSAGQERNMGSGTFLRSEAVAHHEVVELPVMTGDDYLRRELVGRVDAIKLDVQGFELEVLAGLRDTLIRDRPLLWFECSAATRAAIAEQPGGLRAVIPYAVHLLKFVSPYRYGVLIDTHLAPCTEAEMHNGDGNYVAVPVAD